VPAATDHLVGGGVIFRPGRAHIVVAIDDQEYVRVPFEIRVQS